MAVAIYEADRLDEAVLDILLRLLDVGFRLIIAGHDVASLEKEALVAGSCR